MSKIFFYSLQFEIDSKLQKTIMKVRIYFLCLFLSILLLQCDSVKVIFAKNTTLAVVQNSSNPGVISGTIINVPANCKAGFVYESVHQHRCRRISG